MTDSPRFIHLRVHTEYSLLEGAVRLKKLPGICEGMDMPAVAVTDKQLAKELVARLGLEPGRPVENGTRR